MLYLISQFLNFVFVWEIWFLQKIHLSGCSIKGSWKSENMPRRVLGAAKGCWKYSDVTHLENFSAGTWMHHHQLPDVWSPTSPIEPGSIIGGLAFYIQLSVKQILKQTSVFVWWCEPAASTNNKLIQSRNLGWNSKQRLKHYNRLNLGTPWFIYNLAKVYHKILMRPNHILVKLLILSFQINALPRVLVLNTNLHANAVTTGNCSQLIKHVVRRYPGGQILLILAIL